MIKKCIKWAKYYKDFAAKRASGLISTDTPINYGTELYRSGVFNDKCWVVTEYENEYNVFCEKITAGAIKKIKDKIHMASFNWQESAKRFALEMFLVSNGQLKRRDTV